jgi:uncharacterized membrane protein
MLAFSVLTLMQWRESLWLDETTTAKVAQSSIAYYFHDFAPTDFHPPLYYLTTKYFTRLVGVSDLNVRIPSLVAGLLTIVCVYVIARKYDDKQADIVAALMGCSPLFLYYAMEARMYALVTLLVSAAILALQQKKMVYFMLLAAASYLTHYFALLMIPVYWYLLKKRPSSWKYLLGSSVPFLLWTPLLLRQLAFAQANLSPAWSSVIGALTLKNVALIPLKFLWGRIGLDPIWLYMGISVIAVYLWLYLVAVLKKNQPKAFNLLVAWLLIPIALTIALAVVTPVLQYFRLLLVLPALVLITGIGIGSLGSVKAKTAALLVAFSISLFAWQTYVATPRYHRENWKGATLFVKAQATMGDFIVFSFPGIPDPWLYYGRDDLRAVGLNLLDEQLDLRSNRIFYVTYAQELFDPNNVIVQKIEQAGYNEIGFRDFNGVGKVRIFERKQVFAGNL